MMNHGPALPLADREDVLEHAAELILASWQSFDRARPNQPLPSERHVTLLSGPLPRAGSDPTAALDAAADVLDVSLAQSRPRYFAYIGSARVEIGVLRGALLGSHDVHRAASGRPP